MSTTSTSVRNYKNQLSDEGAIIGYAPLLQEPKKETENIHLTTEMAGSSNGITIIQSPDTTYYNNSSTVSDYMNNNSANTINALTETNDLIDSLIDSISNISTVSKSDIIKIKNGKNINDIYTKYNNINGNIDAQVLKELVNEKSYINNLISALKNIYYGTSDITNENINTMQEKLNERLSNLDNSAGCGLDYGGIWADNILNKVITYNNTNLKNELIKLSNVSKTTTNSSLSNKKLEESMNILYSKMDSAAELNENTYNTLHTNIDTTTRALYNYYNKRKSFSDFLALICQETNIDFEIVDNYISYFEEDVKDSIKEVAKDLFSNELYLKNQKENLMNKQNLIALFSSIK